MVDPASQGCLSGRASRPSRSHGCRQGRGAAVRLLVIGKNGQLARSLIEAGGPEGLDIKAVGRPEVDFARAETIAPVIASLAPDLVVNAAAYTAVDKAESDSALAHAINAEAPGRLGEICATMGIPLVHISTDYVFDGNKPTPYIESDPVAPLSVYGRSKLAGEQRVAAACRCHVILRTAWLVSPYG